MVVVKKQTIIPYEGGLKQWAMCHVVDPYVVITPQLITSLDKD